jgi:Mn2+/Fe2+ NRAMP family transporter
MSLLFGFSHEIVTLKDKIFRMLGPGLITGASDDDPSGIATYSQAGAQFGFSITWTLLFTHPLMAAIQEISGRIGRIAAQARVFAAGRRNDKQPAEAGLSVYVLRDAE